LKVEVFRIVLRGLSENGLRRRIKGKSWWFNSSKVGAQVMMSGDVML
jgi:hypothetical protein